LVNLYVEENFSNIKDIPATVACRHGDDETRVVNFAKPLLPFVVYQICFFNFDINCERFAGDPVCA